MTDVILHHFDLSPFAEKVRVGLGLKQAAWKSVDIPIIMPKPDLMPLTGGYRKTPVMQVGADIYCDTQLIMLELERRLPSPPFLLKGREGEARAITMWIDRNMYAPAVWMVMSQIDVAGKFGAGFARDRSDFSGRNFDPVCELCCRSFAIRPTVSFHSPRPCWPTAAGSCWAPSRACPTARSTIRYSSFSNTWASRQVRSTDCPGSSPGRSA
jgi:hypothetical protein